MLGEGMGEGMGRNVGEGMGMNEGMGEGQGSCGGVRLDAILCNPIQGHLTRVRCGEM